MAFCSLKEILNKCSKENKAFWEVFIFDDMKERTVSFDESFSKMESMLDAMKNADDSYDGSLKSASGLSGGDGAKLEAFRKQPNRLVGDFMTEVMEKAVKMGESNACIKRNVAGAVNAVISSQLTKAGVKSAIPADEVIDSMGRIGVLIPKCLKETSGEGLALTPSALKIQEKLQKQF